MAVCEFCGDDAKLTLEHAWPDWALTYVRGPRGGDYRIRSFRYAEPHATWTGPAPDVQVRILCGPCNHDRLGTLEDECSRIWKPLASGNRAVLRRQDLPMLAAWSVKTAMVFEFTADPGRVPYFTPFERRAIALSRTVPASVTVLLARQDARENQMFAHGRDLLQTEAGGLSFQTFLTTIAIGQLVVQVFASRNPERPTPELDSAAPQFARQLWPPRGRNVLWPPRYQVNAEGLWTLATMGDASAEPGPVPQPLPRWKE